MLLSFKHEIAAARDSIAGLAEERKSDPHCLFVLGQLDSTLKEFQTADDEIALQSRRFEALAQELHQARARYRVLFETLPVGCVVTNSYGSVLCLNSVATAMCGGERAIIGKPLLVRIPEEERALVRNRLSRARLGEAACWEGHLLRREGLDPLPVALTLTPLAGQRALPGIPEDPLDCVELLWTVRDLSYERRLQESARASAAIPAAVIPE